MEHAVVLSGGLEHLYSELKGIEPKDLGLAWKRDPDVERYRLQGSPALVSGQLTFVFKSHGSTWGACSGNGAGSLKEAKLEAESYLQRKLMGEVMGFQAFLDEQCFSDAEDGERYEISHHGYRALQFALNGFFRSRVTKAVDRFPDIKSRRTLAILAGAFVGYDIGDLKLMFAYPSIYFSSGAAGSRFLSADAIRFRISTLDNDSEVMGCHAMFKEFPELVLASLEKQSMTQSIDCWIEKVLRLANSAI